MRPEDMLELMRIAPERYTAVRAALHYRGDGPTMAAIRERYFRSEAYRREGENVTRKTEEWIKPGEHPEPDGPFGWRCRIWHVDSRYWRRELELPGGGIDIAASVKPEGAERPPGWPPNAGKAWDHRIDGVRTEDDPLWLRAARDHFWTFYPFDPFGIASIPVMIMNLDLRVEDGVRHAGREAVRLVCAPDEEWNVENVGAEPLRWGADEFEFVVDAERGILLRCASRLEGEDFEFLEVEEVYFDERFPDDVFTSREPLPWR